MNRRIEERVEELSETNIYRAELEAALRATKKDSAPGPDGVRYPQVKLLSQKEKQELADIINT